MAKSLFEELGGKYERQGDYSMLIETLFETTAQLDHFINELQQFGRTKTQIVFSTSVEQREVPVVTEEK